MGLNLLKGTNVSLTRAVPGIRKAIVDLGWDANPLSGSALEADAQAIMVGHHGKVPHDGYFVFFNQLALVEGSPLHQGPELTGGGTVAEERIIIDLKSLPAEIEKVVFAVAIYRAEERHQSFGQVLNAFIRVVDTETGAEIARYDLAEHAAIETAMVFGELYRYGAEWKFRAVGQGYADGLAGMARDFGVNV